MGWEVVWDALAEEHMLSRAKRYPGATPISPHQAVEAIQDPEALVYDPDPRSRTGAMRIIGLCPSAGRIVTVIALAETDTRIRLINAWISSGSDRRTYLELLEDDDA